MHKNFYNELQNNNNNNNKNNNTNGKTKYFKELELEINAIETKIQIRQSFE